MELALTRFRTLIHFVVTAVLILMVVANSNRENANGMSPAEASRV
jgi:hypothetical protein